VSDRTSKIANFGITEAGIRGDRRGNIVQHPFCRVIRPVLPEILRQARVDPPSRRGLAAWRKRRINALYVALEIRKRAIAFSVRRTRQEHVRLLASGDHIGRLHDQAVELGAPACHSVGTKRLNQVDAEATSLLAIVPVAIVGAWRQYRYGNLEVRDGVLTGVLAIPAAVAGVAIVNAVPERAIQIAFAIFMLFVAAQLARRALAE